MVATKWKNELNDELETALSVITTSYMRSDSIITAIEENIDYINPPVDEVFKSFMMDSKLINANIKMASLLIGNIPLIYFLNKDWYRSLMFTPIGKGVLGIVLYLLY